MKFHNTPVVAYVPHGIDSNLFFPIAQEDPQYIEVEKLRLQLFKQKNSTIEFVLFFNSRNIRRKMIPDLIIAFKAFCATIGHESADKCALVLHTQPIDENGTNLYEVIEHLAPDLNIFFTSGLTSFEVMNYYYNIADVTVCIGSNEGWGLSCTESVMAGTPVIANVTGGLQDQLRFEEADGTWVELTKKMPTNHTKLISTHGIWAVPVFPSSRSIQGSVPTPYIFDDRISFEDVSVAIKKWYDTKPDFRETAGQLGREWMMSSESRMSAAHLGEGMISCIDFVFDNWVPKKKFEIINTSDPKFKPEHDGVLFDFTKLVG